MREWRKQRGRKGLENIKCPIAGEVGKLIIIRDAGRQGRRQPDAARTPGEK